MSIYRLSETDFKRLFKIAKKELAGKHPQGAVSILKSIYCNKESNEGQKIEALTKILECTDGLGLRDSLDASMFVGARASENSGLKMKALHAAVKKAAEINDASSREIMLSSIYHLAPTGISMSGGKLALDTSKRDELMALAKSLEPEDFSSTTPKVPHNPAIKYMC